MPLNVSEVGVRESFIPPPGCCFIDIDIEALEMVTLAQVEIWLLNDWRKAKQINDGQDLHCVTGKEIAHTDYRTFFRKAKGKDPDDKKWRGPVDKEFANIRNLAKVPNFGRPGGMANPTLVSYARTSYQIRLGATPKNPRPTRAQAEAEAEVIGRAWERANPNDVDYLHRMRGCRQQDGRHSVIIGHPSIGIVIRRGGATYCAACNSPFQGLGALVAGEITWELMKAMHVRQGPDCAWRDLYGCRMNMHAYDAWLLSCPISQVTEAAHALEALVCTVGRRKVPDVEIRAEAAAMNRWSKSAERINDPKTGNVLVWGTPEATQVLEDRRKGLVLAA